MTYAPINIPAYVASYSGAIAGMGVSGWIVNPTQSNYDNVTKIAGAFAQAFDIAWNDATPLNNLEVAAITSIVQTEFSQRGPGPLANPIFQTVANWDLPARACIALVLESDAYFAGQGINPGTGGGGGGTDTVKVTGSDTVANFLSSKLVAGANVTLTVLNPGANETLQVAATGGGGGSVLPLSNVVFVDKNGSGAAVDGSIANPFITVTSAVEAVVGFGNSSHYTIVCTPYDYSSEELLTLPADLVLTFIGLGVTPQQTTVPNMSVLGTAVYFENCTAGGFTGQETDGITDGSSGGGVSFNFKNANCYKVTGNNSYLFSAGTTVINDTNTISALGGTFQNIGFSGTSFSDSGTDVTVNTLTLENGSGFNCQSIAPLTFFTCNSSSFGGNVTRSGNGTGSATNATSLSGAWTGWDDPAHPFEMRSCIMSSLVLNCAAGGIAMDSDSMAAFGKLLPFTSNNSTVNAIASLDSEIQFTTGPDAAHTYNMSDPDHVIVGDSSITVNRVYKLDTTGGIAKQLFVIDNFGQNAQIAIEQALDNAVLYTFTNPSTTHVRATFRVISVVGNTFELFSVEKIN